MVYRAHFRIRNSRAVSILGQNPKTGEYADFLDKSLELRLPTFFDHGLSFLRWNLPCSSSGLLNHIHPVVNLRK